jgi:FKBP-type peptidyl-prolyl cis-trans isomerase (trigger factor)
MQAYGVRCSRIDHGMKLKRGVKLLEQREGIGEPAKKGDRILYNLKMFLHRGEEVPLNERQAEHLPAEMIRTVNGYRFIEHRMRLGSRDAIAGVEDALIGMKQGGYRKVEVSPHLAFGEKGLPGLVPANAVLFIELWLREIVAE